MNCERPLTRTLFTALILLIVLGSSSQGATGEATNTRGRAISQLKGHSLSPVTVRFHENTSRLSTIQGRFPASPGTPEAAARNFLNRHSAALGLNPGLSELSLARASQDRGGRTITFRQQHQGIPLFEGWILVAFDSTGDIRHVTSGYNPDLPRDLSTENSPAEAVSAAESFLGSTFELLRNDPELFLVKGGKDFPGLHLAWMVSGFTSQPLGEWNIFVDARSGEVVRSLNALKNAGPACTPCNPATDFSCANVFQYNAVEFFDDASLRDPNNIDAAQSGCKILNLTSGSNLTGSFANTSLTTGRVGPPYTYQRSTNESGADEMTAYYHADRAKRYLDSLGFPGVMAYSVDMDARDAGIGDQSFFNPSTLELHFGSGGVDDGQDPDIVYHEYGHAMQHNQVPGWGSAFEGGAMGEGFGDYWAATLQDGLFPATLGPECVGDWDATSYNPFTGAFGSGCLRRVDNSFIYPRDSRFEVHADGEIWSAALWHLRTALGSAVADSLVIKAQSLVTPSVEFIDAADALVAADVMLNGGANTTQVHASMASRGLPRSATPASTTGMTGLVPVLCETTHNYSSGEFKQCVFTQPGAARMRVHYTKLNTESGFDWVRVSDGQFNQVEQLSGTPFGSPNSSGFSAAVTGEMIIIRFKADSSIQKYGFQIDEVHFAPGAGRIPDGNTQPGTPLTVQHAAGGDITLSWGSSCAGGDTDFAIYEGTIGAFTSHASKFCSTGSATSMTFTPGGADSYYLVVPSNGAGEGSYGNDSTGAQRTPAAAACLPQEIANTCI